MGKFVDAIRMAWHPDNSQWLSEIDRLTAENGASILVQESP